MDLVDPKLKLRGSEITEAQRVIHTALLCLQYSDEMRPLMSRVVNLLQGDASSESDISVDQPGRGFHTSIPGYDNVPASGSIDRSGVSQPNSSWYRGHPSDSGGSQVTSASDVQLIETSTSSR